MIKRLLILLAITIPSCGSTIRDGPEAIVYLPPGYNGAPTPVLYWLHWYGGSAESCPPMLFEPNFVVVSPKFRPEADWQDFDLTGLINRVEMEYPASQRWIEGYSRGAYGAVWHASHNPGLFSQVVAIAGGYPDHPFVRDDLRIIAGRRDARWFQDSVDYALTVGAELETIDSSHDPAEFYSQLDWRGIYAP